MMEKHHTIWQKRMKLKTFSNETKKVPKVDQLNFLYIQQLENLICDHYIYIYKHIQIIKSYSQIQHTYIIEYLFFNNIVLGC